MILYQGGTLVDDVRLGSTQVDFLLQGTQLLYYRRSAFDEAMGHCQSEQIEIAGNKYWELIFLMDAEMDGDVETGLIHPDDARLTFVVERSEDLQTWTTDFLASGAPEDQMDGTWLYRARSPVLVANPITSITLADVELTGLPNYPYQLPDDAAQLETDLVDEGFTGATVTALGTSAWWVLTTYHGIRLYSTTVSALTIMEEVQDLPNYPYSIPADNAQLIADLEDLGWDDVAVVQQSGWEIEVPDVPSATGYSVLHKVAWATYYEDRLPSGFFPGGLVGTSEVYFSGSYVNEDDIRTNVATQFGRVRAVWTP
jgi:hypothetical protein